ncbi:MAG: methyltransferase domain-containing protein [Curvibacter sp.]|nr:MAG: methyltransferase domain-containing protein [Curvibacter sp.]
MKNIAYDESLVPLVRENMKAFLTRVAESQPRGGQLLEIGPQERQQVRDTFHGWSYHSFDIVDTYRPDFVGDITRLNPQIPDQTFDCILCMDVLEHCLQPFDAIIELRRMLKDGGLLLLSSPLNWRIHGPVPDCWRFTEHGYKVLLKDFEIIEIDILETPGRDLFPVHYNVAARCNRSKNIDPRELKFRFI